MSESVRQYTSKDKELPKTPPTHKGQYVSGMSKTGQRTTQGLPQVEPPTKTNGEESSER